MAIKLENKPNVDAPSASYPYGKIKDNAGGNTGTPVNTVVYGDFHQFFAKMLAESGVLANGLPDNFTNGFQYFEALLSLFGGMKTKVIPIGDWNMDSNPLKSINHGIADFTKIRNVEAIIINDGATQTRKLQYMVETPGPSPSFGGIIRSISTTAIALERISTAQAALLYDDGLGNTGLAWFDNTDYDATSYNRGWVIVSYEA